MKNYGILKFLSVLLIIAGGVLFAQQNKQVQRYYSFQKQKNYLTASKDEIYITFAKGTQSNEIKNILDKKTYIESPPSGVVKSVRVKVKISMLSMDKIIQDLKKENSITSVYPVYITDGGGELMLDNVIMYKLRPIDNESLVKEFLGSYGYSELERLDVAMGNYKIFVNIEKKYDALDIANLLDQSGLVEFSIPNFTFECQSSDFTPNDTRYNEQWFLPKINMPAAWGIQQGRNDIIVAVIDGNGFDLGHQEFSGQYTMPYDAVNNDNDPEPENNCSNHGTPCAGLISALTNNNSGVASVGFNIKVMPIKIGYDANCNGGFSTNSLYMSRAESWIVASNGSSYVVAVSNSWSVSGGPSSWIENSYRNIHNNSRRPFGSPLGAVILFASGNGYSGSVDYPASITSFEVIAVGASDQDDHKADFSNYGSGLDIVAPGVNCLTLDRRGNNGYVIGDYYSFSGTSAAAPIASAIVGILASHNRSLPVSAYEWALLRYAAKVGGYAYIGNFQYGTKSSHTGYGRVDAYNSLINLEPYLPYDNCINGYIQLSGTHRYSAINDLQASCNNVLVEINGNITFEAGNSITLSPPFSVLNNSNFAALITPLDNKSISYSNFSEPVMQNKNVNATDDIRHLRPVSYSLSQNYPNPFNPSTLINYALKENASVKITVYDILGRVVKILVNDYQDAGYRSVIWDGTNNSGTGVATGIYVYKIEAGSFVDSKKMLLLK